LLIKKKEDCCMKRIRKETGLESIPKDLKFFLMIQNTTVTYS